MMSRISLNRMSPTRVAWIALGVVAAVLVVLAAAVGIGAFIAQKELRAAVPVVSQLQDQFGDDDPAAVQASVQKLQGHAAAARGAADTPLWWVAEQAPFVGPTLHAVRESTVAIDELAQGVLPALSDVDPGLLRRPGECSTSRPSPRSPDRCRPLRTRGAGCGMPSSGVDLADTPGLLRG
ncbi:hypothetical protein HR12_36030, partial [Microbacterium sp. SUBG005]